MIIFNFHYGYGLISTLIRWFSRGRYNHVSIQLGDFTYEAIEGKGVIKTLTKKWNADTVVESVVLTISDKAEQDLFKFLEEQVGKKYDYRGVLSFLWGFTRPKEGAWFCSELAMITFVKTKGLRASDFEGERVSPHLFAGILKLVK